MMGIDHAAARRLAAEFAGEGRRDEREGTFIRVDDAATQEFEHGWFFQWGLFTVEPPHDPVPMWGNMPVAVDREFGCLFPIDVMLPPAEALNWYRRMRAKLAPVGRLDDLIETVRRECGYRSGYVCVVVERPGTPDCRAFVLSWVERPRTPDRHPFVLSQGNGLVVTGPTGSSTPLVDDGRPRLFAVVDDGDPRHEQWRAAGRSRDARLPKTH